MKFVGIATWSRTQITQIRWAGGTASVRLPRDALRQRNEHLSFSQIQNCSSHIAAASSSGSVAAKEDVATADVKVEEERLPNSRVALTVTLPGSQSKRAWQRALRKVGTSISAPGFRKGKQVPESVLFQHVSKKDVIREAVEILISSSLTEVGDRYQNRAFTDSLRMDSPPTEMVDAFVPGEAFTFRFSFDIQPELTWKGEYRNLKINVEKPGSGESDESLVEKRIRAAIKEKGKLRVVTDRGLELGDVAMVDFEARIAASGEAIAGSKREGMQIDTSDAENSLGIPGIAEELVGMAVGESKTCRQTVPDTWWEKDIRGSEIDCDLKVKEVFSWDLPELTDELAGQLLPSCSGVAELREKLGEAQRQVSARDAADAVNQALTAAVADIVEVDVPEAMVREAAMNEYQAQLLELQARGELDMKMIDQLATDEMLEKFIETRREELTQMQRGVLGFEAIFEAEGMSVSPEEIEKEAAAAMGEAATSGEDMDKEKLQAQVYEVLKAVKVLAFLTEHSDIQLRAPEGSPA